MEPLVVSCGESCPVCVLLIVSQSSSHLIIGNRSIEGSIAFFFPARRSPDWRDMLVLWVSGCQPCGRVVQHVPVWPCVGDIAPTCVTVRGVSNNTPPLWAAAGPVLGYEVFSPRGMWRQTHWCSSAPSQDREGNSRGCVSPLSVDTTLCLVYLYSICDCL